jgi:predicted phosphoribosyltransferase
MAFKDRQDAGIKLAERLMPYRRQNPFTLALPRGGVEVGFEVAAALQSPLDVIVARKIGAPWQPELGIGAVAPGGVVYLDERAMNVLGLTSAEIEPYVQREIEEMERRLRRYRGDRPFPGLKDCTVILVDDGLATGVTARAAIRSIRKENPKRIVLAVPVAAFETAYLLRAETDDLVAVETPMDFRSVGLWYDNFDQTTDEEVMSLLREAEALSAPRAASEDDEEEVALSTVAEGERR